MALIRRIDSSTSLVKGYIDDGNFDGFLIHARKGLLRLRGPITDEKEERKVGSLFLFLRSYMRRGGDPSSLFATLSLHPRQPILLFRLAQSTNLVLPRRRFCRT